MKSVTLAAVSVLVALALSAPVLAQTEEEAATPMEDDAEATQPEPQQPDSEGTQPEAPDVAAPAGDQPGGTGITGPAAKILTVLNAQQRAWNEGDIDSFMAGYWHSDELRFASGGSVSKGWVATLARYKKRYDSRAKMGSLSFSDVEVTLLGDDSALVFGRWKLERAEDTPGGLFSLVFRKLDGAWVIVHDHTSTE